MCIVGGGCVFDLFGLVCKCCMLVCCVWFDVFVVWFDEGCFDVLLV